MNICVDSEVTSRLANFFKREAQERWICVPSLNQDIIPWPTYETQSNTEELSLTIGDGKLRILTDITNYIDWDLLQKLVSSKNVEVRHCRCLDMALFLLPEQGYTLTLVKKSHDSFSIAYPKGKMVLFESDVFDYKKHYQLFSMFGDLWGDSEIITVQKLEMYMNLAKKAPCFLLPENGIPAGTYLLHSSKRDLNCSTGVFCSRLKGYFSFLQEDETVSFSYIMGLDIPKETKYIINCKLYDEIEEICIKWIYAVDASSPLDFDDFLWNDVKGKKEEFVMIEPNYIDENIEWFPTREIHFDLPSPKMAARKMFMLSELHCSRRKIKNLEKKLNAKMRVEKEFKESVLHKSFVKVK